MGLCQVTGRHVRERVRFALQAGAILSAVRAICESPACGIKGDNPDARFGRWVADIMSDTMNTRTAHRYRTLYEAFGHLSVGEVNLIGLTNGYTLALAPEPVRAQVIEHVQAGGILTASEMRRLMPAQPTARPAPAPLSAAPAPLTTPRAEQVVHQRDLTARQHNEMQSGWTVWNYGYPEEYGGDYAFEELMWLEGEARRLATENDELRAEIRRLKGGRD